MLPYHGSLKKSRNFILVPQIRNKKVSLHSFMQNPVWSRYYLLYKQLTNYRPEKAISGRKIFVFLSLYACF